MKKIRFIVTLVLVLSIVLSIGVPSYADSPCGIKQSKYIGEQELINIVKEINKEFPEANIDVDKVVKRAYCRPDSDLDVCIVGDNITKADRKILIHAPRHGMDLLDVTNAEFNKERNEAGSVFNEVFNKGVLVYKKGVGIINGGYYTTCVPAHILHQNGNEWDES